MEENKEPTNREIYKTMGEFFDFTKVQFEKTEHKFELINSQLQIISKEIKDVKINQNEFDKKLVDMDKTLKAIVNTVDADSLKVIDHETRITKLEPATA